VTDDSDNDDWRHYPKAPEEPGIGQWLMLAALVGLLSELLWLIGLGVLVQSRWLVDHL
jgi:hypothetical protein